MSISVKFTDGKVPKYGIVITTYEINDEENPVITHVAWGDTLEKAIQIMESHCISDFFLSSTFRGELQWRDKVLKFEYENYLVSIEPIINKDVVNSEVINKIRKRVETVYKNQYDKQLDVTINELSKM